MVSSSGDDKSMELISLPHFGIQSDWQDSLRNPGGSSWVTIRRPDQQISIHGTIKNEGTSSASNLTISPPFMINTKNKDSINSSISSLSVVDEGTHFECTFVPPVGIFSQIHPHKSISCLDCTPDGLGVSASGNLIKIWDSKTGHVRRTLDGHVSDVSSCCFFPSGSVILSGGSDMRLRITCALSGNSPVQLIGHRGTIMDTAIVDRGRNVLSASKDGCAKLWDVGQSSILATITPKNDSNSQMNSPINSCTLLSPQNYNLNSVSTPLSDREIGTVGKILVLGSENGTLSVYSLPDRSLIFSTTLNSAINCVRKLDENNFAVGCQGGDIRIYDVRKGGEDVTTIKYSTNSPILDILPHGPDSFWVSKSDGTLTLVNSIKNDGGKCKKTIILSGTESDGIYSIKSDGSYIFTSCRDGIIRKYSLPQINKLLSY